MAPAGVARPLPWGWPRPAPAGRGGPSGGARRGGRSRDDRMTTDPELLPRPRLMRSLAGVWKLASLTAPAGWGKTTVLAEWCSGRATLWVTATAAERDPAQLLGSFLASGSRLRPPFGRSTLARFSARRAGERGGGPPPGAFLPQPARRPGRGRRGARARPRSWWTTRPSSPARAPRSHGSRDSSSGATRTFASCSR